jgi:hypothetical protein
MSLKRYLVCSCLLIGTGAFAQNIPPSAKPVLVGHVQNYTVVEKDTSKENKEPRYFYLLQCQRFR